MPNEQWGLLAGSGHDHSHSPLSLNDPTRELEIGDAVVRCEVGTDGRIVAERQRGGWHPELSRVTSATAQHDQAV
jgi:hypothetical protein